MRSPTRRTRVSPPSTSRALTGTVVQLIKRLKLVYKPAVTVRWAVRIRDAAVGDSGEYECQVTTPNTTTIIVNLNVLGKLALGCVILTPWPPSAGTEHFTQPRISQELITELTSLGNKAGWFINFCYCDEFEFRVSKYQISHYYISLYEVEILSLVEANNYVVRRWKANNA